MPNTYAVTPRPKLAHKTSRLLFEKTGRILERSGGSRVLSRSWAVAWCKGAGIVHPPPLGPSRTLRYAGNSHRDIRQGLYEEQSLNLFRVPGLASLAWPGALPDHASPWWWPLPDAGQIARYLEPVLAVAGQIAQPLELVTVARSS